MPLGPKRAPGRYEVPVSNGAPKFGVSPGLCAPQETGHTYEGNIVFLFVAGKARPVWETSKGGDA